jgi:hypothetical protein
LGRFWFEHTISTNGAKLQYINRFYLRTVVDRAMRERGEFRLR